MARSEANGIQGKSTFTNYPLTRYPDAVDSNGSSDPGYNENMRGFTNLKDYNMAEHVNALADAIMVIERVLGIHPHVDKDGINQGSVGDRIGLLENKDYDPRYGGVGWSSTSGQTLVGHTHTGSAGHPSQIKLDTEVQGKLGKQFLDLTNGTSGLTGADLMIDKSNNTTIASSLNDKLSVSLGGRINGPVSIYNKTNTRTIKEYDAMDAYEGTLKSDNTTLTKKYRSSSYALPATHFFWHNVENMNYGKWVMAVRARIDSKVSHEILHLRWYNNVSKAAGADQWGWAMRNYLYIKGTDFIAANQWQTFYLTFDHFGDLADTIGHFHVWKPDTPTTANIDIDTVTIMPTHPAIYDI